MSFGIGAAKIAYQKTKVFDTAGAHTFIHPLPGKNIEVFVELIGGAGGGTHTATAGADGGDTIWNTGGSNDTAAGGSGATDQYTGGLGFIRGISTQGNSNSGIGRSLPTICDGLYGNAGYRIPNHGETFASFAFGGSGYVKRFNATVSTNINITVGAAGAIPGDNTADYISDSQSGACIVHYNVIESETPVMVSATPEVDEYVELAWQDPANVETALTPDSLTDIPINTEHLDTANNCVVNGDDTFTLQAGTYGFDAFTSIIAESTQTPVWLILRNETDGENIKMAYSSAYVTAAGGLINNRGYFKIATAKTFKLQVLPGACPTGELVIGNTSVDSARSTSTTLVDKATISLIRKAYS